jgi:hypothetical protein
LQICATTPPATFSFGDAPSREVGFTKGNKENEVFVNSVDFREKSPVVKQEETEIIEKDSPLPLLPPLDPFKNLFMSGGISRPSQRRRRLLFGQNFQR